MEFDKSKVFTVLNADELKVGSKVILADDLFTLKRNVQAGTAYLLKVVEREDVMLRFVNENNVGYALAYLVEEPEEKKLKWTELNVGDVIRYKKGQEEFMIIGKDYRSDVEITAHIFVGSFWIDDKELANGYEKVN